jgi:phospholipid/cholesterol/gamma-HCH transport system permease protein
MSSASSSLASDGGRRGLLAGVSDMFVDLGAVVIRWIETLGDMTLFMLRTFSWLFSRLPRRDTLIPAFYNIGVLSLPVVALTGTFIGMVLAVQSYSQFKQFGFENRLGALINLSMCRELGPVLAATMLAGRVGSAIAAEIGTMRVRADRRPHVDGRQPAAVPGSAAVSRLPVDDSVADGNGNLHGRGRRLAVQR